MHLEYDCPAGVCALRLYKKKKRGMYRKGWSVRCCWKTKKTFYMSNMHTFIYLYVAAYGVELCGGRDRRQPVYCPEGRCLYVVYMFLSLLFPEREGRKKSKKETKFVMPRQEREKEPRWMCVWPPGTAEKTDRQTEESNTDRATRPVRLASSISMYRVEDCLEAGVWGGKVKIIEREKWIFWDPSLISCPVVELLLQSCRATRCVDRGPLLPPPRYKVHNNI